MRDDMNETEHLIQIAVRLREATAKRDFDALARLNHEVHLVADQLAADGRLRDEQRHAIALMKIAHRDALKLLAAESQRLVLQMTGLGEKRTGWEAYASNDGDGRGLAS
jgi:hypothetical protein